MLITMKSRLASAGEWLISFSRQSRQIMAVVLDLLLCLVAASLAFYLRTGEWTLVSGPLLFVAGLTGFFWLLIALRLDIYQSMMRFSGGRTLVDIALGCLILGGLLAILLLPLPVAGIPRTITIILPLVLFALLALSRTLVSQLLVDVMHLGRTGHDQRRILIYGAGMAGTQLMAGLRREPNITVVGFIDDDPVLDGRRIEGRPVWHRRRLHEIIERHGIEEVLLALPSARRARRQDIINELTKADVAVRMLPSVANLIDGQVSVTDLRPVEVDELLGRDPVAPDADLLTRTIIGKRVMVTGAGGSIGSELCRQILRGKPAELVLVDHSEFALYAIEDELRAVMAREGLEASLFADLANVSEDNATQRLFERWRPQTVLHAAAYKHVPLVEANPIAGARNNILGTLNCVMAAESVGVERFTLISSDKAVRPTNIMGATKRACELILQARAQAKAGTTVFSMVRFGNVLGSSGSVVPRFRSQIAQGGPITITDREITRYFMTIPEAAQLVIQASAMARGGEVFLLDMGEPIRILDLAMAMIRLSGLSVRDENHPDGDIAIEEIGLRPGEKLYEELLIDENALPTSHPRISCAEEKFLPWEQLSTEISALQIAVRDGNRNSARAIIRRLVPEYREQQNSSSPLPV